MASVGAVDPNDETKQTNAKDIVTLCEDILDKTGLSPTIEMCGRVAFLVSLASCKLLGKY
jgi:hypothetical protein